MYCFAGMNVLSKIKIDAALLSEPLTFTQAGWAKLKSFRKHNSLCFLK